MRAPNVCEREARVRCVAGRGKQSAAYISLFVKPATQNRMVSGARENAVMLDTPGVAVGETTVER